MAYGIPVGLRRLSIEKQIKKSKGTSFELPDNKIIRGKTVYVYAIEAFTIEQISLTPGGAVPISAAGSLGIICNFQDGDSAWRDFEIPYYDYIASLNTGYPREYQPFKCILDKSTITVVDDTNITDNEAVFFVIWYFYEQDIKKYGLKV